MNLLKGFSIEVMPKTAAKIEDFRALLPDKTLIYIANIEGTPVEDMLMTARRLKDQGFSVMPHLTARTVLDTISLDTLLKRYSHEVGIDQLLLLAGGTRRPYGAFASSLDLLETGLFDRYGFTSLHFAGHPERNRDIDPARGTENADKALMAKQDFAERTDADVALVTQFVFDHQVVVDWIRRIGAIGIDLPVWVGVAGPAKLGTLLKYAAACGVGASIGVLQKRARDVTKLLRPFEPDDILNALAGDLNSAPLTQIKGIHFFPLGGIKSCSDWINDNRHRLSG